MEIASLIVSIIAILVAGLSAWYTRRQYLSPIRPELFARWYHIEPSANQVLFEMENRSSNTAVITDVVPLTQNISLYQPIQRYDLTNEKDDRFIVTCNYLGNNINSDTFKLLVKYQDKEGNKYKATLHVGKGNLFIE